MYKNRFALDFSSPKKFPDTLIRQYVLTICMWISFYRLYYRSMIHSETDRERLLLVYQVNHEIVQGRFPVTNDLAIELASLLAQVLSNSIKVPFETSFYMKISLCYYLFV